MLKKTKIKIGAAITSGIMGFAAIGTSVGIIENQKTNTQITNNIKTSVIKNDNLNTQSKNYSNYLKDTTLVQVEGLINEKVDQQTEMFVTLSTNQTRVLQYQQELKTKANEIAKIFSTMSADLATNIAGSFAEPEISPWLDVAITGFTVFLDATSITLSSLTIQPIISSQSL